MGKFLQANLIPRNAVARTARASADDAKRTIEFVRDIAAGVRSDFPDKAEKEHFNDCRLFLKTVEGSQSSPQVTAVGDRFVDLYQSEPESAWRWLSIRSGWLNYWPNNSNAQVSAIARDLGVRSNLFDSTLRTLAILQVVEPDQQGFSFSEFFHVMNDDQNWQWSTSGFVDPLLEARRNGDVLPVRGSTLLEMEPQFGIPRDSINTFFAKFCIQTGTMLILGSDDGSTKHDRLVLNPHMWSDPHTLHMYRHVIRYPVRSLEVSAR